MKFFEILQVRNLLKFRRNEILSEISRKFEKIGRTILEKKTVKSRNVGRILTGACKMHTMPTVCQFAKAPK